MRSLFVPIKTGGGDCYAVAWGNEHTFNGELSYKEAVEDCNWLNDRWPKERGWVSVGERVPLDNTDCVLVVCWPPTLRAYVTMDYFEKGKPKNCKNVTHWMPLPDPPQPDECCEDECDCGCEQERVCVGCTWWHNPSADGQWGRCRRIGCVLPARVLFSPPRDAQQEVSVHRTFGCTNWQPQDDPPTCHCEQQTYTTQDIRDIVREEIEGAFNRMAKMMCLKRRLKGAPKDDDSCIATE
jgi:hypothetical protein